MCRSHGSRTPHGGRCLQRSMDAQTLRLHAARNQERHLHHRQPIPWRRDSQLWVDSLCDPFVDVDSIAEGLVSYVHLLIVSFGVKLVYILGVVRRDRCRQLSAAVFCPVCAAQPRSCPCPHGPGMESTPTLPPVPGYTGTTSTVSCWLQPQNALDNNWWVVDLNIFY